MNPRRRSRRVEVDNLYGLVRVLKKNGIAIVYITHKLDEVFALADEVTILRDGKVAGTFGIRDLDMKTLVESMTGKPVSADAILESAETSNIGNVIELEEFAAERMFSAVNFVVGKGSVVGVAGVIGAGKSELARAIVGALPKDINVRGKVVVSGSGDDPRTMTPDRAREFGIGFVSEDRSGGRHSSGPVGAIQYRVACAQSGVRRILDCARGRAAACAVNHGCRRACGRASRRTHQALEWREPTKRSSLANGSRPSR